MSVDVILEQTFFWGIWCWFRRKGKKSDEVPLAVTSQCLGCEKH